MHPFLDGNGRTTRALEALLLQRAGLRDTCFIAMSNYYYDEKTDYLKALNASRSQNHDLTPFLKFGLRGIAQQSQRLMGEIKTLIQKAIFRNLMYNLFGLLKSERTRVIAKRQIEILKLLLEHDIMQDIEVLDRTKIHYSSLKNPLKAFVRDINGLLELKTIIILKDEENRFFFRISLEWPTEITETDFFKLLKTLPKAKTYKFL